MTRSTHKQNLIDIPLIIERDGDGCSYCSKPFTPTHPREWEHYDNNPDNNEIWNKGFVHHECNNRKKLNSDLQILAQEKIQFNKRYVYVCERIQVELGTTEHLTSSQAISANNFKIAEQYITEHTLIDGELVVKDVVDDIVGICRKNNNTGSQSATYRYLHTLCSIAFPFEFDSKRGLDIIRRKEN